MPVEDVFSISGAGTVVTGRIERGVVKVGEEIEIVGIRPTVKTTCTGVGNVQEVLTRARPATTWHLAARPPKREEVERGQVCASPLDQAAHPLHREVLRAEKDEGGRHTPFFNTTARSSTFRTTDGHRGIELPKDKEMVMPGTTSASPSS